MAEPRRKIVENIGVVRGGGEAIMAAAGSVRAVAAELEREGEKSAAVAGDREGRAAGLQRDEKGNLLYKPLAGTGAYAQAYNRAARVGYGSQLENDAAERAAKLRQELGDDSAKFQTQWKGYRDGVLQGAAPEVRADAQLVLDHVGRTHTTAIVNAERQRDYQNNLRAWDARLSGVERDMTSLAETGAFGTPAYTELAKKHAALLDEGVGAKFYTGDERTLRAETIDGRSRAHAIAANAEGAYRRGGLAAADRVLDKILKDPELKISSGDRQRIVNVTQSRLRELESIRRMGIADARDAAQDVQRRLALGYQVAPDELNKHANRMQALGDRVGAQRLRDASAFQDDLSAFAQQPLREQQRLIAELEKPLLEGKGTAAAAERVQAYQQAMGLKARALADDPLAYGARVHRRAIEGDLAALDFSSEGAWQASVARRRQQAATISAIEGVAVPVLSKGEAANLVKMLNEQPDSAAQFDRAEALLKPLQGEARESVRNALEAAGYERERIYMIDLAQQPGRREEMRRQFSLMGMPEKEAAKLLQPEQVKDLKTRVHSAYASRRELFAAIAEDTGEAGFLAMAAREQATLEKAAMSRAAGMQTASGGFMAGASGDPAAATTQALFGHQAIINEGGFARVFFPANVEAAEPGAMRAGLQAIRADVAALVPGFDALPEGTKRQVQRIMQSSAWYPTSPAKDGTPRFALVPVGAPIGAADVANYRVPTFTLEQVLQAGRSAQIRARLEGLPDLPRGEQPDGPPNAVLKGLDMRGDATLMERTQRAVGAPAAPDISDAVKAMVPRMATPDAIQAEIDRRKALKLPTADLERGLELAKKRERK